VGTEYEYEDLVEDVLVKKKECRYSWGHNFCSECIRDYITYFNDKVKLKLDTNQPLPILTGPMDMKGPSIYKCPMKGCYNVLKFDQISRVYPLEINEEVK